MSRGEFLSHVLTHGESAQSFLGTYATYDHFEFKDFGIAYVPSGRTWVMAGPPVGPGANTRAAYETLAQHADQKKKRILAVALNEKEAKLAGEAGFGALWIGRDPWIDLARFSGTLGRFPQAKRLVSAGAVVKQLDPLRLSSDERRVINGIHEQWLDSRKMPPLGFLNQIQLWEGEEYKRYYALSVDSAIGREVVAVLVAVPAPATKTWYLIDLLRGKNAPNGSSEILLIEAMKLLKHEGAEAVNLGVAPLSGAEHADRLPLASRHASLYKVFAAVHQHLNLFYGFKTLSDFKERLNPNRWEPSYLCYYPKPLSLGDARALSAAFVPDGPISAGAQTLVRFLTGFPIAYWISRFIRRDLYSREMPATSLQAWKEARLTQFLLLSLIVIHVCLVVLGVDSASIFRSHLGFDYLEPLRGRGLSLFSAPFLHWDEFHLALNLFLIGIFGPLVEILLGRTFFVLSFIISAVLGQAVSALLYAAYGGTLAMLAFGSSAMQQLPDPGTLIDVGASLGACGLAGALAWSLRGGWILTLLILVISIAGSMMMTSLLPLNHFIAAIVGACTARIWLVHASRLLPVMQILNRKPQQGS